MSYHDELEIVLKIEVGGGKDDPNRFQIGIQEYTFNRWFNEAKLEHLDYPALAKEKLGITHIEYWNRPFQGRHTDRKYMSELGNRSTGEGMQNVLILVDAEHQCRPGSGHVHLSA